MRKQERDRIKARRDGLVARVAELEKAISHNAICKHDGGFVHQLSWASDVLNRQPRQSLDLLKAEVKND